MDARWTICSDGESSIWLICPDCAAADQRVPTRSDGDILYFDEPGLFAAHQSTRGGFWRALYEIAQIRDGQGMTYDQTQNCPHTDPPADAQSDWCKR